MLSKATRRVRDKYGRVRVVFVCSFMFMTPPPPLPDYLESVLYFLLGMYACGVHSSQRLATRGSIVLVYERMIGLG